MKDVVEYEIPVRTRYIAEGKLRRSTQCAIARAIIDSVPDAVFVRVDRKLISLSLASNDMRITYSTPPNAAKFIEQYDAGLNPRPFVLKLKTSDFRSMNPRRLGSLATAQRNYRRERTINDLAAERKISRGAAAELVESGQESVRVWDSNGVPISKPGRPKRSHPSREPVKPNSLRELMAEREVVSDSLR